MVKSRLKVVTLTVFFLRPAIGRDKSLLYMVGSKNGHVGQGFSPAGHLTSPPFPLLSEVPSAAVLGFGSLSSGRQWANTQVRPYKLPAAGPPSSGLLSSGFCGSVLWKSVLC